MSAIVIILSLKVETEEDYLRAIKNYKKNIKKMVKMAKKKMGNETRKLRSKKRTKD